LRYNGQHKARMTPEALQATPSVTSAKRVQSILIALAWLTAIAILCLFLGARYSSNATFAHICNNLQWTIANCFAPVLAWLGYRIAPAADRIACRWFAIAMTSYGIGQIGFDLSEWTGSTLIPANAFYLTCGPLVGVGFWQVLKAYALPGQIRSAMLDSLALTIAVLGITLSIYLVDDTASTPMELATMAAFPISMLGCSLFGVVLMLVLQLRLSIGTVLMLLGLVGKGCLWMVWNLLLPDRPTDGSAINFGFAVTGWMLGTGAALWRTRRIESPLWQRRTNRLQLLLPIVAVVAAVVSVALVRIDTTLPAIVEFGIAVGGLSVVVMSLLRQSLLISERDKWLAAERKSAEVDKQYKILAHRLSLTAEASGSGIWELNFATRKFYWDARMYALFGIDATHINSDTQSARSIWKQCVHPDDRAIVAKALRATLQGQGNFSLELRIIKHDGELSYLETMAVLQRSDTGRPKLLTGVAWNITPRVLGRRALIESEAELSAIFDNSVVGIVLLDQLWNMHRVNRASCEMLGYSADDTLQLRIEDVIHPDEQQSGREMFGSVASGVSPGYQRERRYRHAKGHYIWVRVTVYPVMLKDTRNYVLMIEDISQRRRAEQQAQEAQRNELAVRKEFAFQLMNAQEKERLRIANELHDGLGQNLSIIKNRTQLALERLSSPADCNTQLTGILRVAADAIAEVRGLAHNLRPMHLEQLGLTAALTQLAEEFSQAHHLQLVCRIEPIDDVFSSDQVTHVYRLVQEALNNIGKHAHARCVRVLAELDVHAVRLTIGDDGKGFVIDRSNPSGLGLSSMSERAHMLGGTMKINSAINAGCTIIFELPIQQSEQQPLQQSTLA
jgi:PAS domain S-box-containing protein